MKKLKYLALILAMICVSSAFVACELGDLPINEKGYNVTFESNGGTSVAPIKVDGKTEISFPKAPTKEGYFFAGWFVDNETFNKPFNLEYILTNPTITSITVYASWSDTEVKPTELFSIWFESNGGTNVDPIKVDGLSEIVLPKDPTKEGYKFGGWFVDNKTFKQPFNLEYLKANPTITKIAVFAMWIESEVPDIVFVDFDSNGGSPVAAIKAQINTIIAKPADPTKEGYTFEGWFKEYTLINEFDFATEPIKTRITLFAKWEQDPAFQKFFVFFDSNEGSYVVAIQAQINTTIEKPADPTKEGYTFGGWFKEDECVNEFDFKVERITQETTLYAKWISKKYTVTFECNGGSPVAPIQVDENSYIPYGSVQTELKGHIVSWYTDKALTQNFEISYTQITKDLTLYAKWRKDYFRVSFETFYSFSEIDPVFVQYEELVKEPKVPIGGAGYSFGGWYKDETFKTKFDFSKDKITESITLYAKWEEEVYLITFDCNGGGGGEVPSQTLKYGETIEKPDDPTRLDFVFRYWSENKDYPSEFSFGFGANQSTTLYAIWKERDRIVTLERNGGFGVGSMEVEYNKTLYINSISKEGYTFVAWCVDEKLTTAFDFQTKITQDITLYAKWKINKYAVSFYSDGNSYIEKTADYGATLTPPAAPTKTGHTFEGWYERYSDNLFDFATTIKQNVSLYAKWTRNTYIVTFDSNGGSEIAKPIIEVEHGDTITRPTNPTKTGHWLGGWRVSGETTDFDFFSSPITKNLTLVAYWVKNDCDVDFRSEDGSKIDYISARYGDTLTTEEKPDDPTNIQMPADPTKVGHTFERWYVYNGSENQTLSLPLTLTEARLYIYAEWKINSYTVTFDSNDGSAVPQQTVKYGETIEKPADPTKTGYTFGWWYKSGGWEFDFATKITENITLYAHWNINSYTVTFVSNCDTSVWQQTASYDTTITEPTTKLTKEGHTFGGWYSDAAFSTSFNFATTTITDNITLYAKWIAEKRTVTFDSDCDRDVPQQIVDYGSTITKPAELTKQGYTFGGWAFKDNMSVFFNFADIEEKTKVTKDITLFAIWKTTTTGITYGMNNSSYTVQGYTGEKGIVFIPTTHEGRFVNEIWYNAFKNNRNITRVVIPREVSIIGIDAFIGCSELQFISVSKDNVNYCAVDDVLYNKDKTKLLVCPAQKTGKVIIPNSVTTIDRYAFNGCDKLDSVIIPNSVTAIGEYAFNGCRGITKLEIPDNLTSIENSVFSGCSKLTTLKIGAKVNSIGENAFNGCSELITLTIPDSVTSIGNFAFSSCSKLVTLKFGSGISSIGNSAFSGCSTLKEVTIPNSVTSMGDSAFSGCSALTTLTIGSGISSISNSAFSGCSALITLTIPNSVTSMGKSAFSGCSALTTLTIGSGISEISNSAFSDCTALKEVTIPNNVTTIGGSAFSGCVALTSITMPDNLTTIGDYAFARCSVLKEVTIPNSVTILGGGAFWGCSSLTKITIPNGVTTIDAKVFNGCSALTTITMPDNPMFIWYSAFSGCSALTSIIIPNSVKHIGDSAFYNCSKLATVTIIDTPQKPSQLTNIDKEAFYGCSILTKITIPDSVKEIGARAFEGCYKLDTVTINGSSSNLGSIGDRAFYDCRALTSITIPNGVRTIGEDAFSNCFNLATVTINGSSSELKSIGDNAFFQCWNLTSITIPSSVTTIGDWAFENCTELATVTIIDTPEKPSKLIGIGTSAFSRCALTSITIPRSVTSIAGGAFSNCSALKTIEIDPDNANYCTIDSIVYNKDKTELLLCPANKTGEVAIPSSVTSIGNYAFAYCWKLTSVTIPNGVTTIKGGAFSNCSKLATVTINESLSGLTSIGNSAFYNCSALTSIIIPSSVTTIGREAFAHCSALTAIIIPNSVTTIVERAFYDCNALTSITIPSSVTSIGDYAFYRCDNLKTINVVGKTEKPAGWASDWCDNSVTTVNWDYKE